MTTSKQDEQYMNEALKEAEKALEEDEVPIGAIIVSADRIIARTHNQVELLNDVTAHAEILALTAASQHFGSKYLKECTLYITLEPCLMCASALAWAQLGRLVWGADDKQKGFTKINSSILHPKTKVKKGILSSECSEILKGFFEKKRKKK